MALGGVAAVLDAGALYIDPFGQVAAMGAAYLMEHVKPLSDALDAVAGDPDQISAYSQTWHNVANAVERAGTDLQSAVDRETLDWTGAAGDAYRAHINEQLNAVQALRNASTAMSEIVHGVGLMVAFARGLVRDLVAQALATLAVRLPTWLAAEGLTFGLATPVVVAQAAELIAHRGPARVARVLRGVVEDAAETAADHPAPGRTDPLALGTGQEVGPQGPARRAGPHGSGLHEGRDCTNRVRTELQRG